MSDPVVKESRRRLRSIHQHLSQTQLDLGAQHIPIGLVEVVYHPTNQHPMLNYVSPRQKTAWIPAPEIRKGIDHLRSLNRTPRVMYIEGLYPPLFAKSIRELGMRAEYETSFMTYRVETALPQPPPLPEGFRVEEAAGQTKSILWWHVWRNAGALTQDTEPVTIGQRTASESQTSRVDLLLYKDHSPVGVVRLTRHEDTAHIAALAVSQAVRSPETVTMLYQLALQAALQAPCALIFTTIAEETDRPLCRALGLVDSGSRVCYVEGGKSLQGEKPAHEQVAQSVFVLRQNKKSPPDSPPDETNPGKGG